ncbi:MAG TPA: TraB/GumN family protein [Steroidobacteraceae bacterium]|nr:TraB/GumN family protein [Steroidobacteraceae bacterium]
MKFPASAWRDLRGLAGALLLACAAAGACAAPRADGSSVWAVKGRHNTVYFAGSVHALPKDHAELSPELELAYRAADAIVMEVDLDDLNPLEAVQFVAQNGTLPAEESLSQVVGAERYRRILELARSIDVPEIALARLEPWAAAMVLTQFALMKSGFDPQLGVDMQVSERARADGKPIDGLETIIDQLGIFDSRTMDEQIKFLVDAADDVPAMHEDLARLIAAWRAGDIAALEREFNEERAESPALYDQLLGARNRRWMPKIEALFDEQRNYLVVVGALHFVGRDGLLELLARAGHEPVALPAPASRQ